MIGLPIAWNQAEYGAGCGGEILNAQLEVEEDCRDLCAIEEVLQVAVGAGELGYFSIEFGIDGLQLFVEGLQLLLRGLQLFIGRLIFLVCRLQLFVRSFQLFACRLVVLLRGPKFVFKIPNSFFRVRRRRLRGGGPIVASSNKIMNSGAS